jgi:hypothetical protein
VRPRPKARRRFSIAAVAVIASIAVSHPASLALSSVPAANQPSAKASAILTAAEAARITRLLRRCPDDEVILSLEQGGRRHVRGADVKADIVRDGPYYDYRWHLRHATFCGLIVFYVGSIPTALPRPTHRSATGGDYVDRSLLSAGSVRVILVLKRSRGR